MIEEIVGLARFFETRLRRPQNAGFSGFPSCLKEGEARLEGRTMQRNEPKKIIQNSGRTA